jgi:predicted Zn-dependent peptidase
MMKSIFAFILSTILGVSAFAFETLQNGAPFFATQDALPRSIYMINFQGGPASFAPEKQGVIGILKKILEEGPAGMSQKEYQDQLFKLGADINYGSGNNFFRITLYALPGTEAQVFALLQQTLQKPKLAKADFEKAYGNIQQTLIARFQDMRTVLFYAAGKDLLNYAPAALNGETSPASFAKITFDDVKDSLGKLLNYESAFFAYAGSTPAGAAKTLLETQFAKDLAKPYKGLKPSMPPAPAISGFKYTLVEKPGATDNQILFFFPQSVQRDGPPWVDAGLTMDLLGGGLHGLLGKTLRTERGLTYNASSQFNFMGFPYWNVWTFGGVKQTKDLLTGVPEILATFQKKKYSAKDLLQAKAGMRNAFKAGRELPQDLLGDETWYYIQGLNTKFPDQYEADLTKTSLKNISAFKNKLQTKNAAVYLMGDKDVVLGILDSLGVKKESVRILQVSDIL